MDQKNEPTENDVRRVIKDGMSASTSKYIIAVVVFVLMLAIWIGKSIEVKHVKEEAAEDTRNIKGEATRQVVQSHEEHLRLLAKPFVWAIRAEVRSNNLKQVRLYMAEMVEKTNFERIVVVDTKGKIIASTDKKLEGQLYTAIGRRLDLIRTETSLENVGNRRLILRAPITAPAGRIGTLVIQYKIQPLTFR